MQDSFQPDPAFFELPPVRRVLGLDRAWGMLMLDASRRPASEEVLLWRRDSKQFCLNLILEGGGLYRDTRDLEYSVRPGTLLQCRPEQAGALALDPQRPIADCYVVVDGGTFEGLAALQLVPYRQVFDVALHQGILDGWLRLRDACRQRGWGPVHRRAILFELIQFLVPLYEQAQSKPQAGYWQGVVHQATQILERDLAQPLPFEGVARELNVSYTSLRRMFRKLTGQSMREYRIAKRLMLASHLLLSRPVQEVAEELGYCDPFTFSTQFRKHLGVSPSRFKKKPTLPSPDAERPQRASAVPGRA